MAQKAKRHIHKYHKISLAYANVWACALPDCSHYMPPHMEDMVSGKYSYCWECNDRFILDPIALEEKQPRCTDCRTGGIEDLLNFQPVVKVD